MSINKASPVSNEVISYIGCQPSSDADELFRYDTSFLTQDQALHFINDEESYTKKACVSLNYLFMPFATHSDPRIFPSGNPREALAHRSVCLTVGDELNSDAIYNGAVGEQSIPDSSVIRCVGINVQAAFVGRSGSLQQDEAYEYVAGPLDVVWSKNKNKWVANIQDVNEEIIYMGFCTSTSITSPSTRGQYTTFNASFGACRNYDLAFDSTNASNMFVIAVKVSGTPVPVGSVGGKTYESSTFFVPVYLGCEL